MDDQIFATTPLDAELRHAIDASLQAGTYLKTLKTHVVQQEIGRDLKLLADRESEQIILKALAPTGLPVLTEETGEHGKQQGRRWIVDPIDGTVNFFRGMTELSCISIALWEDETPLLGVVNRFAMDEIYHAVVGYGAFLNDQPLRTSSVTKLSKAVFSSGYPHAYRFSDEEVLQQLVEYKRYKKIRMLGTATLMATWVAAGRLDLYVEEGAMLWDIAAGIALIEAAGGTTRWKPLQGYQGRIECFANETLMKAYDKK